VEDGASEGASCRYIIRVMGAQLEVSVGAGPLAR
jgi:hypothetical protein